VILGIVVTLAAPVWAILHIAISVFVMGALAVHGRDITKATI
jgi:hypothetical protein